MLWRNYTTPILHNSFYKTNGNGVTWWRKCQITTQTGKWIYDYILQGNMYSMLQELKTYWIFNLSYHLVNSPQKASCSSFYCASTWSFSALPVPVISYLISSSNSTDIERKDVVSSCIRHSNFNWQEVRLLVSSTKMLLLNGCILVCNMYF